MSPTKEGVTVYRWPWVDVLRNIALVLLIGILFNSKGTLPLWLFFLITAVLLVGSLRSRQIAIMVEPDQVRYVGLGKTEMVIPLRQLQRAEVVHTFNRNSLRLHLHSGQFMDWSFPKQELASIAAHIQEAATAVQQQPA